MIIRLNKALRELNIGRQTAVGFLQKRAEGLGEVKDDLNFKLNDKQYAALVEAFKKDAAVKEKAEQLFKKPEKKKDRDNSKRRVDSGLELGGHQKYTPLGKIDLDSVGKRPVEIKSDASPEKKSTKPETAAVSQKVEAAAVKEEAANKKPEAKAEEPKAEAAKVEPKKVEAAKPEPAAPKQADAKPAEAKKPVAAPEKAAAEKPVVKPSAPQPAPQAPRAKDAKPADKKPTPKQHQVIQKPNAVKVAEVTRPSKDAKKGTEIFRTKTETRIDDTPKVTVLGKIDLSAINSSTRPKKKSRAERQRERQRQQNGGNNANANNRGKRERINNNKVDINAAANQQTGNKNGNGKKKKNRNRDNKPAEVNDEDVARQVKETLARLTSKSQNKKGAKYRKEKREAVQEKLNAEARAEKKESKVLKLTEFVTVSELATMMNISVTQVISTLMSIGIMASINQRLDAETINMVAEEFGFKTEYVSAEVQEAVSEDEDDESELVPRAPIVTVMGHVDHGKTSLLDHIRNTNVIAGEAGGITQHIGAYSVTLKSGRKVTFLDTPGHEAFTAMRARGAQVTDIAIIIIAADDSVMPTTKEAIAHCQAAGVPMVFAINKIDKPGANADRIREDLANMNLLVEEWGGKYQCQEISAKKGVGVDDLMEKVLLEADMLDLKANPNRKATGTVIESSLDKGRGYVSTVLVSNGTLHVGDIVLAGTSWGRVKALFNERNQRIDNVKPAEPTIVLGLNGAPTAGDQFHVIDTEQEARDIANKREQLQREQGLRTQKRLTLGDISHRIARGEFHELNIIVKGDTDGSIEALSDSFLKLSTEKVQVNVISKAVGQISENDVMLASASDAVIVGFQVRPSADARKLADREGVEINTYSIIYDAIDDIKAAMVGMLDKVTKEVVTAEVEVKQVFKISKVGTIAGALVTEGKVHSKDKAHVVRDGIVVHTAAIAALKRYKDDVKEVVTGLECGISLVNYNDIQVGDIIETFTEIEVEQKL
uniref:translation initiation factor IF-2 n=1 Tax=Prevotella sp. TaxID=59823 RepID=UPI0040285AE6